MTLRGSVSAVRAEAWARAVEETSSPRLGAEVEGANVGDGGGAVAGVSIGEGDGDGDVEGEVSCSSMAMVAYT